MTHTTSRAALAEIVRRQEASGRRLDTARRLASWVGEGRQVTSMGAPRPADAAAAARACGLTVPETKVTHAVLIPGFAEAWDLAVATGMLELSGERVTRGRYADSWPDGPDFEVLEMWTRAFANATACAFDDDGRLLISDEGVAPAVLLEILLSSDAWTPQGLRAAFAETMLQEFGTEPALLRLPPGSDPFDKALRHLIDWGIAEEAEKTVRPTPLGRLAADRLGLVEDDAEHVDPELSSDELLTALGMAWEDGPGNRVEAWLSARPAEQAADKLLLAASTADPFRRYIAFALIKTLGAAALPAWQRAVHLEKIGPYARLNLYRAGLGPLPGRAEADWLAADMAAAAALVLPGDEIIAQQLGRRPSTDQTEAMKAMRGNDGHPDAVIRSGPPAGSTDAVS